MNKAKSYILMNNHKIILDLCGGTGAWSKPYKDAGYTVYNITYPEFNVLEYVDFDDKIYWSSGEWKHAEIKYEDIYGIFAAPPCTMFSLARTKAKKPRDLKEGMKVVEACMKIIWEVRKSNKIKFWALENPMGYLRQFLGKPPFTFDPSEFGEDYNKKTDLWGYFNQPKKKGEYKRFSSTDKNTRKLPSIPSDYKIDTEMTPIQIRRSITPQGFAKAFFKANH